MKRYASISRRLKEGRYQEDIAMPELNRPQIYMAGLIVLLLGLQLRLVNAIVLNDQTTKIIAERFESHETASTMPNWFAANVPVSKKTITPPKWMGWSLLSIGGVMVLHSLALR